MKYQTCMIFLRPCPTLFTDTNFIYLATGLSINLTACRLHFPACRLMKQACLYQVSSLSQIWWSWLYLTANGLAVKTYSTVGYFNRPVCNCSWQAYNLSRSVGNFSHLGPRVGKLYNRQAWKWNRQAVNKNWQACYTNRQVGNCNRQACNILPLYGLLVSKSVAIKRPVGRCTLFNLGLTCRETTGVQLSVLSFSFFL